MRGVPHQGHTAAAKGTKIKVIMLDGTSFIDKFKDRTSRYLIFDNRKVRRQQVRSFTIHKPLPHDRG